ncbi:Nepenthesin [Bertholletia excelsa]
MKRGAMLRVVVIGVLGLAVLSAASESQNYHHHQQQQQRSWWQSMFSGISSSAVSPVGFSSVVFPLHGNVYPTGSYHVQLNIGQPPKPYFLDPDTGSDLTWLQCDVPGAQCTKGFHPPYRPSNDRVPCRDPLCASLQPSEDYSCDDPDQCDYQIEYADGGSSLGVLLRDTLSLNLTNGMRVNPRLAIGCGYDQVPGTSNYHPMDGVLGLGKGKTSIISQLHSQGIVRNVVGHCLSSQGGGFLFFGDGVYDPSRLTWMPMSRDYTKHYSPGLAELIFGGKATGVKNLIVVFDSGSSYTYLNSKAYHAFISLLKKELKLQEASDDQTLPLCWKGKRPFKNIQDVRNHFKPLTLKFSVGWRAKSQFEIAPEAYLIISSKGNACLGVLNGTEVGLQYNLIGDISMQDKMVIYDNEKEVIGWGSANCDQFPRPRDAFI